MEKIKLGIIGATGMAGREALLHQKFLENQGHDYAEIAAVTGNPEATGRPLGEVFNEREEALTENYDFWDQRSCPKNLREMELTEPDSEVLADKVDYVISAIPSGVAAIIEPKLRERGVHVFSNASEFRWAENVPLLLPEVNHEHIERTSRQEKRGKQANNPNCTTAGFVPLIHIFQDNGMDIQNIDIVTMQAISGKGDAVSNPDYRQRITGNVIDDWSEDDEKFNGEERKSEIEPQKILGNVRTRKEAMKYYRNLRKEGDKGPLTPINASTNRVPSQYGHLEHLTFTFKEDVSPEEIKNIFMNWEIPDKIAQLPTTPEELVIVKDGSLNPSQDVFVQNGMGIAVGRVKLVGKRKVSLYSLSHNLRRGATWTARQSLELFLQKLEGRNF